MVYKFDKNSVDYSIYLVTDSTMIPSTSTFLKQVEGCIEGGATLIQLREKKLSTLDFVERARKVHALTQKAGIPLVINDRIDVALAIDAEGVHIGQDDMPVDVARRLLGEDKLLGVTCSNVTELDIVCKEGIADNVGIGTVYQTQTKTDVKTPDGCGPIGIRSMLKRLHDHNADPSMKKIKCVAIGGINHTNAAKVLYQCVYKEQKLDGLAIVSCLMASEDSKKATLDFKDVISSQVPWARDGSAEASHQADLVKHMRSLQPLVHHITNNVVKNFSANVTLAIGASPIMSELGEEYEEFATNIPHLSLVVNLGTPTSAMVDLFKLAVTTYNKHGKPIVFDPVAAGASKARLECCRKILNSGHVDVIKGNLGEILAIHKLTPEGEEYARQLQESATAAEVQMLGVDSKAKLSEDDIILRGKEVAQNFRCVVVITGATNYVIQSDEHKKAKALVAIVPGGSPVMGSITGTGCSLGSTIGAFVASRTSKTDQEELFRLSVTAVTVYNKAGEKAASVGNGSSPGTFMINFLDSLSQETTQG